MNKWPDDELERQMLTAADLWPLSVSVANCACHIRALLTRVRELEKREVISITALQEITEADVYARQIADAALEALKGTP